MGNKSIMKYKEAGMRAKHNYANITHKENQNNLLKSVSNNNNNNDNLNIIVTSSSTTITITATLSSTSTSTSTSKQPAAQEDNNVPVMYKLCLIIVLLSAKAIKEEELNKSWVIKK